MTAVPEGGVVCQDDIPATTWVGLTVVMVTFPDCRADAGTTIWPWGLMEPDMELGVCGAEVQSAEAGRGLGGPGAGAYLALGGGHTRNLTLDWRVGAP